LTMASGIPALEIGFSGCPMGPPVWEPNTQTWLGRRQEHSFEMPLQAIPNCVRSENGLDFSIEGNVGGGDSVD